MPVALTTVTLIREFGQRLPDRECRLCGDLTLVSITYDEHCTVLLCTRCDTERPR